MHMHMQCILQQKQVPSKKNWSKFFNNIEVLDSIFLTKKINCMPNVSLKKIKGENFEKLK